MKYKGAWAAIKMELSQNDKSKTNKLTGKAAAKAEKKAAEDAAAQKIIDADARAARKKLRESGGAAAVKDDAVAKVPGCPPLLQSACLLLLRAALAWREGFVSGSHTHPLFPCVFAPVAGGGDNEGGDAEGEEGPGFPGEDSSILESSHMPARRLQRNSLQCPVAAAAAAAAATAHRVPLPALLPNHDKSSPTDSLQCLPLRLNNHAAVLNALPPRCA